MTDSQNKKSLSPEEAQRIKEGLDRSKADSDTLDDLYPELVKKYLYGWAAVYKGKLYVATTWDGLKKEAEADNVPLIRAALLFLAPEEDFRRVVI